MAVADFWIVSSHRFVEHATFEIAEGELSRLQTKFPKQNFRIYRCKTTMRQSGNYQALVEALKAMLPENCGMADDPAGHHRPSFEKCEAARAAIAKAGAA